MQPDYERNYLLIEAQDKVALRFLFSVVNIEAYNDATKTASDWFLTWDILEDAMPFLTQPAIEVDIQWTDNDLKQKVQELCLEKQKIVILINRSKLKVMPQDSVVLGAWGRSPLYSLLDPTRVVMDATMSNILEVGDGFLYNCSSLKEVDLSPLCNVQKVGDEFLYGCLSLKEVNLRPLSNVLEVGNRFLYNCSSLKEVELNPLCNVQKVGNSFLDGCSSLEEVDLSPLSNVQEVGYAFLYGCSSLKEVDLSPLSNAHEVGASFLFGCSSLTRVILPASPPGCLTRAMQYFSVVTLSPPQVAYRAKGAPSLRSGT